MLLKIVFIIFHKLLILSGVMSKCSQFNAWAPISWAHCNCGLYSPSKLPSAVSCISFCHQSSQIDKLNIRQRFLIHFLENECKSWILRKYIVGKQLETSSNVFSFKSWWGPGMVGSSEFFYYCSLL